MAAGALGVSTSAVFIDVSRTSPATATLFRCAFSVPLLVPFVVAECRRHGLPSGRQARYAVLAGIFFAGDALWWTQAIGEVGAGLSTVLVNAQVAIVPLLALLIDREPISRRFLAVLPVMVVGIVLTGGVLEPHAAGTDPVAGTWHATVAAVCYSGFLFLLRRGGGEGHAISNYLVVVLTAALAALVVGPLWGQLDLTPTAEQVGWLVLIAVAGQVTGWLLVGLASPHLRAEVGAALLLLTPVGALLLGAVFLSENPSVVQLGGCALVLGSAYAAAARRG